MADEQEEAKVTYQLFKPDGTFKQTITLPMEHATIKKLTMPDGVEYQRQEGSDNFIQT